MAKLSPDPVTSNQFMESVITIAKRTGVYLTSQLGKLPLNQIAEKGKMDFVTSVDKNAEIQLVEQLAEILPEAGFIAEEGTSDKRGERYNWIIDPLDGTTNFIHGVNPFSISIALMDQEELVLGIIHDPVQNECFNASKGGGAYLNGTTIQVSNSERISQALIATGFPYTDFSLIDPYMDSLRACMEKTHGVRRLGSAAIDLAYVACGRYDGFYEYHLKPWDVAAGTVLIREAGGSVCDFHNGQDFLFGETYVGTNGKIHKEFMQLIGQFF